ERRLVAGLVLSPGPQPLESRLDRPQGPPRARCERSAFAPPPPQRVVQAQVQALVKQDPVLEQIDIPQVTKAGIGCTTTPELARRAGRWIAADGRSRDLVEVVGVVPAPRAVVLRRFEIAL